MAATTPSKSPLAGRLSRRQHLGLVAVAAAALALRLLYLWGQSRNNPLFEIVRGDAYDHHAWAQAIAFGPGMEPEPYYRAPFYYYLLAGFYRIVGPSIVGARIAGACLGALTTYAISRLGADLAGYRAGLIAGLLAGLYWPAIYFDGELLTVGLECLLEVTLILTLLVATRRNSLPLFALAGVVWGLCAITRPNFLALAPAVVIWVFIALPTAPWAARKWLATAVVLAGAACVIAPVTLRNARVGGEPVLITYSGGLNFYIGNNPDSDGVSAVLPGGRRSLQGGFEDARRIPQAEIGRRPTPGEISDYWYDRGFEWIRAEPESFAQHLMHKFRLFWSPVELPNNQPIRFLAKRSEIPGFFAVGFPLLAVLGLAGYSLLREDWKRWFLPSTFLIIYMGTVILFFCNARYRLPIYPLLALSAGAGLSRLSGLVRDRRWRSLLLFAGIGLAVVLALATNPPKNRDAFHRANRGEGHKALGDRYATAPRSDSASHEVALTHYKEAVRLKPGSPYMQLALARELRALGQLEEARAVLARASQRFAGNAEIRLEFGQALEAGGQLAPALEEFDAAVRLQPAYGAAHQSLGCLLVRLERFQAATGPLETAIELQPNPLGAHICLGNARLGLGETSAALVEFAAALEVAPLSPDALRRMGDTYLILDDADRAIRHYRMALDQKSRLPASSRNLATALRRMGEHAEAIAVLEQAVRHSPRDGELLSALAFALATAPQPELRNGNRALRYAKRAAATNPRPGAEALDAEAASLAELGRYEAAGEVARHALESAKASARGDLVPGIEARLEGYRAGQPYRSP